MIQIKKIHLNIEVQSSIDSDSNNDEDLIQMIQNHQRQQEVAFLNQQQKNNQDTTLQLLNQHNDIQSLLNQQKFKNNQQNDESEVSSDSDSEQSQQILNNSQDQQESYLSASNDQFSEFFESLQADFINEQQKKEYLIKLSKSIWKFQKPNQQQKFDFKLLYDSNNNSFESNYLQEDY